MSSCSEKILDTVIPFPVSGLSGASLVERVAAELQALAGDLAKVEAAVGALASNRDIEFEVLRDVQALDLNRQKAEALAGVLARLAGVAPAAWAVEPRSLLAGITLSDLASRLSGEWEADQEDAGDFEAF